MTQKISLLLFLVFSCLGASEEYFIILLVNARHLDSSSSQGFLKSVAKHPSDGSKNGDVGHAWIYLKGDEVIEGGHSGEFGILQPCYMEGVMDNILLGAKNPVSYLWAHQCDGCFQKGNGGHDPTFAAKVPLSRNQYLAIYAFIQEYPYCDYCLTERQCCTFVREIGEIAGVHLKDQAVLKLDPFLKVGKYTYRIWEDPCYENLPYGSPDQMELSLKQLVEEGKAEDAKEWYLATHKKCLRCRIKKAIEVLLNFPIRYFRYCLI